MKNLLKKMKTKKGFTLIEMLIVVAIIAVLAAILIPTVSTSLTKSKEAADIANLRSVVAEAEVDMLSNGEELADVTANISAEVAKLNKPDQANVDNTTDSTKTVVTYKSKTLEDGNETSTDTAYKSVYSWTLEDPDLQ